MTINSGSGPNVAYIQNPPQAPGGPPPDYNQDIAPSAFGMGLGLLDPRYGFQIGGAGNGSAQGYFFSPGVNYVTLSQAPSVAAVNNIAAAANPASGTPLTLVASTGAGITVMTAPLFLKASGNTVPISRAIDGLPGYQAFGQSAALQAFDSNTMIARAVSLTGVASGSGGAVTVRGYDVYGQPMAETITMTSGATTTNGKKAFKFVTSITPGFTDTHTISAGTADVYGLPLKANTYGFVNTTFNNAPVTSPGFVAADATTVSATTGDVRGTITATSDGTKRLQVMQGVSIPDLLLLTTPGVYTGLYGLVNFTS